MLINLLFENPVLFVLIAAALVVSICVHEFAHAYTADKLGDSTARFWGRVTLNPKAHLDPVGTILLLFAGFGWGRPVPFDPTNLRHPKRDSAIIAFAGPFSNFVLAILFSIIIALIGEGGLIGAFLYLAVFYNLILGFFNLIPVHPLDGFKVVNGFLPEELSWQWMQMAPFGVYILLLLIFTRTTSRILTPFLDFSLGILGLK